MTEYKTLTQIHHSLNRKIEQFSHIETLQVAVQVEDHVDDTYDVVAMLFDSSDTLLMDEVYMYGIESEEEAMENGNHLLSNIEVWIGCKDVALIENVNCVSIG